MGFLWLSMKAIIHPLLPWYVFVGPPHHLSLSLAPPRTTLFPTRLLTLELPNGRDLGPPASSPSITSCVQPLGTGKDTQTQVT